MLTCSSLIYSFHSFPWNLFIYIYNLPLGDISPFSIMYNKIEVVNNINTYCWHHHHAPLVACCECWSFLTSGKFRNLENPYFENITCSSLIYSFHSFPWNLFIYIYNLPLGDISPFSIMYNKIEVVNNINTYCWHHHHAPLVACCECWSFLTSGKFRNLENPYFENIKHLQNYGHLSLTADGKPHNLENNGSIE